VGELLVPSISNDARRRTIRSDVIFLLKII
jgi:hypothetical protein